MHAFLHFNTHCDPHMDMYSHALHSLSHHHLHTPTYTYMYTPYSPSPLHTYTALHATLSLTPTSGHIHVAPPSPLHTCTHPRMHTYIILSLHQLHTHTYDIIHMYTCTLHSVPLPYPPPLTYHSHQMNVKKLRGRLRLSSASLKTSWVNRYNSTFEHKTLHIVPCHGIFVMPITSEPTLSECYNNII